MFARAAWVRFELTERFPVRRFSRPLHSTTLPPRLDLKLLRLHALSKNLPVLSEPSSPDLFSMTFRSGRPPARLFLDTLKSFSLQAPHPKADTRNDPGVTSCRGNSVSGERWQGRRVAGGCSGPSHYSHCWADAASIPKGTCRWSRLRSIASGGPRPRRAQAARETSSGCDGRSSKATASPAPAVNAPAIGAPTTTSISRATG